jgi:hypothetical protein
VTGKYTSTRWGEPLEIDRVKPHPSIADIEEFKLAHTSEEVF